MREYRADQMTSVDVLSIEGEKAGTVELPAHLFDAKVSDYALYRAVVAFEANKRQGNASTKTRAEVNRSGRKHHRQKGTGMARRGTVTAPLLRGGGVAFGPKPRSYHTTLTKPLKRLAFSSALSLKERGKNVRVLDDFEFQEPSTKSFAGVISACGLEAGRILFITPQSVPVLVKSSRNITGVTLRPAATVCTYDVVSADLVVLTRKAVDVLAEVHRRTAGEESQG